MTARQAVQLAASLACAAASTGVALIAALLTHPNDPRDEHEEQR